jgi:hypothetical protein
VTSRSSESRVVESLASIPEQQNLVGVFVSQTGPLATINQGQSTVQARVAAQYPFLPGDAVRLDRRDGELLVLGPSMPRSSVGRVVATGSPSITVEYPNGSGVRAQMPYNSQYVPAVNDTVLIDWDSGGAVVCKLTATPGATAPPTATAPATQQYRQTFTAIDSGSFQAGRWWTNEVWSSDNNIGGWFYGSKIRDTIPDTAQILATRLYLPARQVSGNPSNLGRHTSETKPAGTIAVVSTAPQSARQGWVEIPTSLIDVLKVSAGGIGVDRGGYTIWRGTLTDGLSGALDITYNA